MTSDDYGQTFHDGETTGAANERRDVVAYLKRRARGLQLLRSVNADLKAEALSYAAVEIEALKHLPPSLLPRTAKEG